jgi:hypothetical protein
MSRAGNLVIGFLDYIYYIQLQNSELLDLMNFRLSKKYVSNDKPLFGLIVFS